MQLDTMFGGLHVHADHQYPKPDACLHGNKSWNAIQADHKLRTTESSSCQQGVWLASDVARQLWRTLQKLVRLY